MSGRLSDTQIQDYLDGNASPESGAVAVHLRACERCRKAVSRYQALSEGLRDETGFELPADFAKSVTLKVRQPDNTHEWALGVLLSTAALLAAVVAVSFFVDVEPLLGVIGDLLRNTSLDTAIPSTVQRLLSALNINSRLATASAVILLTIGIADRLILSARRTRTFFLV